VGLGLAPTLPISVGSIWARGPADVTFFAQEANIFGAYVSHFDGLLWSTIKLPIAVDYVAEWGDANEVFLGGPGAVYRWDEQTVTTDPATGLVLSLWGFSESDVYGVGDTVNHWDGATWTEIRLPDSFDGLSGVWGSSPSDVYVVGGKAGLAFAEHWDGVAWRPLDTTLTDQLTVVYGTSATDVFIGGMKGEAVHFDGARWTKTPTDTIAPFRAIAGARDDVFAATGTGVIRWDGARWSPLRIPSGLNVRAIATVGTSVWFGGGGGGDIAELVRTTSW
jgi:hypothetical protein